MVYLEPAEAYEVEAAVTRDVLYLATLDDGAADATTVSQATLVRISKGDTP